MQPVTDLDPFGLGAAMEVPALPLAPRRPSSDQTLMMALGLDTKFLQQQDFELDQRLRQLPSGPLIFLHQEKMLHHVFTKPALYNANSMIAGCAILATTGPKRLRTKWQDSGVITSQLLRTLPLALPLIEAEAGLCAMRLLDPQGKRKANLGKAMDDLACRVLARLMLPATPPEAVDALIRATSPTSGAGTLNELARLPAHTMMSTGWRNGTRALRLYMLQRRLAPVIKTMRMPAVAASLTGLNGLDILLQLVTDQKKSAPDNIAIARTVHALFGSLRDQLRTMLVWTFSLLAHQPAFRHACEVEADMFANSQISIAQTLEQAVFAKAAIEESWRLYPPVPVMVWRLSQDDKIGRISIKAGSHVAVSPYVLHRHKDFWTDADRYDPSRFLHGQRDAIKPYGYMPFGGGTENCPNARIFLPLMTVIVMAILRRARLSPPPNTGLSSPVLRARIEPSQPVFMEVSPRARETE